MVQKQVWINLVGSDSTISAILISRLNYPRIISYPTTDQHGNEQLSKVKITIIDKDKHDSNVYKMNCRVPKNPKGRKRSIYKNKKGSTY